MTQAENPFAAGGAAAEPPKTSGLAITSLILSLICCLPITTIPGVLLGLVSAVSISKNPARKGMGLAITAIILGIVFTAIQGVVGYGILAGYKVFRDAPMRAIEPGLNGDLAAFKSNFNATHVPDDAAQAFLDEMNRRYGTLTGSELDFAAYQSMPQPAPGQTVLTMPWLLVFDGGERLDVDMTFDSQNQGGAGQPDQMIFSAIRINDPQAGDLVFPPEAAAEGGDGG